MSPALRPAPRWGRREALRRLRGARAVGRAGGVAGLPESTGAAGAASLAPVRHTERRRDGAGQPRGRHRKPRSLRGRYQAPAAAQALAACTGARSDCRSAQAFA